MRKKFELTKEKCDSKVTNLRECLHIFGEQWSGKRYGPVVTGIL